MLIRSIDIKEGACSAVTPRALSIWAMVEGRIGDDRQVLALASALNGSVRIVRLDDTIPQIIAGRALNSLGLHAPWHRRKHSESELPDLFIAAGGRAVTLARRVKQESRGRTKTVFLGRPWARLSDFDLVVTTPQYGLPELPNVQVNLLPLNRVDADRMSEATLRWLPRLAHLPRPWIGALVGGDSGSFRMTTRSAARLGSRLSRMARKTGGSVLLATSARTPAGCADLIKRTLDCPAHVHVWHEPGENPYLGILALADRFVVTGESASMVAEASNTGRRVDLFELRERFVSRILTAWLPALGLEWSYRVGARSGYWTPPRNMHRLHGILRARGYIGGNKSGGSGAHGPRPIERDLARTIARIAQLYAPELPETPSAAQTGAIGNQAIQGTA